jgi:septal ring factor EnvC (AmiA/AmiB activator)
MRGVAVIVGSLLVVGGAAAVVLADQQRQREVDVLRTEIERADDRLDEATDENLRLAERLTTLRSQIAEQDRQLTDTTGFLP